MGFQSAFGNVGVLLVFLTSAPLYLALGWRATFIVFAIWTLADVVLTLTFLRGRHSARSDDPQTPSISKPQTRRMIPLFFVLAAFISGGTYAVILNFANIFLGTRAHLDVSQANLIVSSFIAFASLGAIATGGSTRFVPTNVLLAISYLVAACSVAAFTLLSGNAILATITLLATGFSISATYPLTYTELSRYLGSIGQQSGRSFGVLSSGQTIGASILVLASGYVSQFLGVEGAIRKREDGRYELTDKGKDEGTFPFGFPFSQRPNSVDSMVSEMKDFVSYFEDLAKSNASKIAEYKDKLKDVAERLTRLFEQS